MKLQTLLKHNLTVRDGIVLEALQIDGGASPKTIVQEDISAPSLTQIADKLISLGFVKRKKSNHDRRVIKLNLTKAGKELVGGH
jgi:DNA-binding MarR family transcriptional regulator